MHFMVVTLFHDECSVAYALHASCSSPTLRWTYHILFYCVNIKVASALSFTLLCAALWTLLSASSWFPDLIFGVHHMVLYLSNMLDHWFPKADWTFWPTSTVSYHFWTLNKYAVILCQTLLRTCLIVLQPMFRNYYYNCWGTHGTSWCILNGFTYMVIWCEGTWFTCIKTSQFM
jgi:hypothetical protein